MCVRCYVELYRRYRLVTYHYSNAHTMYSSGRPMMRPLLFDFPMDETAANITTQWCVVAQNFHQFVLQIVSFVCTSACWWAREQVRAVRFLRHQSDTHTRGA